MNFYAIRYFVVKSSMTLFPLDEGVQPKDLFTQPLIDKVETDYYSRKYTARILNEDPKDQYLIGYLFKSTDTHVIQLDRNIYDESDTPNWEKLFFLIDTIQQLIIFEFNTPIATPENVKNVLYKLTNRVAKHSGYEIKLEFVIDKFAFWDIISASSGIYQIAFDLNAPNLFGGSKKATDWLKTLKEAHNMTHVAVDFRNEEGQLKYEHEELESYRDYADSGGGTWTLGILQNGSKKRFKSANHLKKSELEIDTNDPKEILETLSTVIERLRTVINSFDDNNR